MHKIDSATAQNGKFVAGNPSTGTSSTQFTPDWCNAVQEELANAIGIEGRALNKGDNTQLKTTLANKFYEYTAELTWAGPGTITKANSGTVSSDTFFLVASQKYDMNISFNAKSNAGFTSGNKLKISISGTGITSKDITVAYGYPGATLPYFFHAFIDFNKSSGQTCKPTVKFELVTSSDTDNIVISDVRVDMRALNHA